MHKSKGQALVEFIIVMPILIFIVIGIIDFGNILYQKYQLENILDTVTDLYNQEKISEINQYLAGKDITIDYSTSDNMNTIKLSKRNKYLCTPV